MASPRRICVVTGSRADYGLLRWLMTEIAADRRLTLQIVATGMHLDPRFGETASAIEADGFVIDRRVPMLLAGDDGVATAKSTGLGVIGFADTLAELRPDLLVILGDRFEILAAAQAALFARIPVAHLHGGELTLGAFDDAIRHALTKLSHLHFVAAPAYRQRVIQLGEAPDRVFAFGALGNDNFQRLPLLSRRALAASLGFAPGRPFLLVTYHPATLAASVAGAEALFSALTATLQSHPDANLLITGSNADPGHGPIARQAAAFVQRWQGRAHLVASLGQVRYLSALGTADVVIGNSSSGLLEAPVAGTPTVNIGDRQKGRLRAASVIDCADDARSIAAAIAQALSPKFRAGLRRQPSPTAGRNVARRIKTVLARVSLAGLTQKGFHDLVSSPAARDRRPSGRAAPPRPR